MLEQAANELEQIELSIDDAKHEIEQRDKLKRLVKNTDFKELIDTGYFEKEAIRLVHLKSDRNVQSEEEQDYIEKSINAIGFFRQYLRIIIAKGNAAERALAVHEEAREEILNPQEDEV